MLDKAKKTIALYNELTAQISSPEVLNNHLKLADLSKSLESCLFIPPK